MHVIAAVAGFLLILTILIDGFETVVQPRRVTRRYRISRVYFGSFWAIWRYIAREWIGHSKRRAGFLSAFGPLSLLGLFFTWVAGLVLGFGLLHCGLRDPIFVTSGPSNEYLSTYIYLSGTTFFTLGYGDVTPITRLGRVLAVLESGLGFGFLAAILSYLPALFQAFSKREVDISLLDARAGSPPTAAQFIVRSASAPDHASIDSFLAEWERWAAELLESQLSFPVLGFYRSQHDNQSWLAALTTVLDTCAVRMTQLRDINTFQSQMTFAMARHAAVDLALVLRAPRRENSDRLTAEQFNALRQALRDAKLPLIENEPREEALRNLRSTYEPFLQALGERLLLNVPPIIANPVPDNWQRSAWMKPTPGIGEISSERHFE